MSVTIIEALENAELNLQNVQKYGTPLVSLMLAESQLHNARVLLEKGYSISDEVEPLLDEHGDVENVPEKVKP